MSSSNYAWVYPGQGSQTPGMGRKLLTEFPHVHEVFTAASELSGYDLQEIRRKGPSDLLGCPDVAEPLLAATQIAYTNVLFSASRQPTWVAGYSAGEVAAFYAAGILTLKDALRCATIRGRVLAQYTSDATKMIAVSRLDQEQILNTCSPEIEIAAWNAPDAMTLVGPTQNITEAATRLTAQGGNVQYVDVHGPWHSQRMRTAAGEIHKQLLNVHFESPRCACLLSHCGRPEIDPLALRRGLAQQVALPIHWQNSLSQLWEMGSRHVIEVGTGRVLKGYIRRAWTDF